MNNEEFKCCYCDKVCKSNTGLKQHEQACKLNPNRVITHSVYTQHHKRACIYCGREIDVASIDRHEKSCLKNQAKMDNAYHLDHDDLLCKFCHKEYPNKNSLVQHEVRCPNNPDRKDYDKLTSYMYANVKGHTKEDNEQIAKQAKALKLAYNEGRATNKGSFPVMQDDDRINNDHNQLEIQKWIDYTKSIKVDLLKHTSADYIEGYLGFCVNSKYELEHRYIVSLYVNADNYVVHHLDEDKHNNVIDNLIAFASVSDHVKYHTNKNAWLVYDLETHLFRTEVR